MFHFSTDRLAGLDTVILKITTPPKVSTPIPNPSFPHDMYEIPVKQLKKRKSHRRTPTPLADRTASNNLAPRPHHPTSSMPLHSFSAADETNLPPPASLRAPCSPDLPTFRPLPPLPSASTLQLPSFLDFSTRSFASLADSPPPRSITSLPASVLFHVYSPVAPARHVVVHKAKDNKGPEGPQWIPAFHHPNSPYVPWSSPVRRRILPPPSPLLPSSVCPPSPCIRSGAVAPEPWASSIFSQARNGSAKERLSSSWKSFKSSIKKGARTILSHVGNSRASLRMLCVGRGMLSAYDDTDIVQPSAVQSTLKVQSDGPRDSFASFVSSDSTTLAVWLAGRHDTASCGTDNTPRAMSVGEYELMGSWLDLRHRDKGGWVCGVQDCNMHSCSGSTDAAGGYPNGLCVAMPFDGADLLSITRPSPGAPPVSSPFGPFSAAYRFHSLPRLSRESFDIRSAQEAKPVTLKNAGRCLTMPGGWTFS